MDPLVGVYSALTRASLDGEQSWTPNEVLTLDQALCGYTRQGAWAWHAESHLGALKVGAKADIVAWSADLYQLDPAGILEQRAGLTIVAGEIVHDIDEHTTTASSETRFDQAAKTLNPNKSCSGHAHS